MIRYIQIALFTVCLFGVFQVPAMGQPDKDISNMTREEVLNIPYEELIEMPLDQLLQLADIVGVSLEELYEMILNKDVVSASKKVESSFEAPLSTSVISYDEIISSGARTIEEALRLAPGLIVREKTNGNFDLHIRGNDNLPSNHMMLYSENSITLVMIDGRPVYNYVHGGTFWESLPIGIEDIDRIEIVRGPSSALYGPNAVSGVVNIITKIHHGEKVKASVLAEAGMLGSAKANLAIGKGLGEKFDFRVTGNYHTMQRNSDQYYVFLANGGNGDYISKEVLDTLSNPKEGMFKVFDPADDVDEMYPDPWLSRRTMGANAYLFYNLGGDVSGDLKLGAQSSEIQSSTMGDNPSPLVGRISNTGYFDLNANVNELKIKVNGISGWQDIVRQDTGFKVDMTTLNASAEYDFKFNNLEIRPGVAYQQATYNDIPYLREIGQGFLNGEESLTSMAVSLRADYRPMESLRFIAALRGENYNTHNDPYISYQLMGVYQFNDQYMARAVYSKANRGPFLVDSYANYLWNRSGRPNPGYIQFQGAENLDLLTMNMIELGFRMKPQKNIMIDVELFHTKTNNYGALYPDSVNLNLGDRPYARMTYQNIDLESRQMGATALVSLVSSENAVFKVFGTYQRTELYDVITYPQDKTIEDMLVTAFLLYQNNPEVTYSTNFNPEIVDEMDHEWTPAYYGGLVMDFKFLDQRLHLNSNTYFYSDQTFQSKYGSYEVKSNIVQNLRLSYNITDDITVYANGRNLLSNNRQFPYMDKIQPIVLGGLILRLNN